jgi:hypothetical protein
VDNIHLLPRAPYSLFSLSKATANGGIAIFTGEGAYLLAPNSRNNPILKICEDSAILYAHKKGNLWVTEMDKPSDNTEEGISFDKMKQSTLTDEPARRIPKKNDSSSLSDSISIPKSSVEEKKEQKSNSPSPSKAPHPPAGIKSPHSSSKGRDLGTAHSFTDTCDSVDSQTPDTPSDAELSEDY